MSNQQNLSTDNSNNLHEPTENSFSYLNDSTESEVSYLNAS